MKTFRRIAAAAVALVMALSMAACSTDNGKTQIGIIQLMDHPALNSAREGFIAALEEEGYKDGENIEITYQNGQGEANNLSTIADKFIGDKMDLVLAIATPAAQAEPVRPRPFQSLLPRLPILPKLDWSTPTTILAPTSVVPMI